MKKHLIRAAWIGLSLTTGVAFSTSLTSGFAKIGGATSVTKNTAVAASAELGPEHNRVDLTAGVRFLGSNSIKVTGEFLAQKNEFYFVTGEIKKWVEEYAGGLALRHIFNNSINGAMEIGGYYGNSPSANLAVLDNGVFTDYRHISGSDTGGLHATAEAHFWHGNETRLTGHWDSIRYRNQNTLVENTDGLGGELNLSQIFHIGHQQFKASADISNQRPYNFYRGEIDWMPRSCSDFALGFLTQYTDGKLGADNTLLFGGKMSFMLDPAANSGCNDEAYANKPRKKLSTWVSRPAVYIPRVLAKADAVFAASDSGGGGGICSDTTPVFSGTIPNESQGADGSLNQIDVSSYFSGSNLEYAIQGSSDPLNNVVIDTTTGVITYEANTPDTINLTVTATNCASITPVSSNTFTITIS